MELRARTTAGSSAAKEGLPGTWIRHFMMAPFDRAGFARFLAAGIRGTLFNLSMNRPVGLPVQ